MWIAVLTESKTSSTDAARTTGHLICDIINQYLAARKFRIKGIRKTAITLTEQEKVDYKSLPIKGVSPVLNVKITFDFNRFNQMSNSARNETMLNLIEDLLTNGLKDVHADRDIITAAIKEVRTRNFRQKVLLGKPKVSKDRKHKASIEYELLPGEAIILAIVFFDNSDSQICKTELIRTLPDYMFVSPYLGSAKWITNSEFELVSRTGDLRFIAYINDCRSEMIITPNKTTTDDLIDSVLISSASTPNDQTVSLLEQKIRNTGKNSND